MNVRFAPGEVRFRITREELDQLRSGRPVVMIVALPGQHAFQASIVSNQFGTWRLDSDPTGLWLALPKSSLDAFTDVPSADGLEHCFELASGGAVNLVFEVDIRC